MIGRVKNIKQFALAVSLLLFLPLSLPGQAHRYSPEAKNILVENAFYRLDFDTVHKQPAWVCYMLTQSHITGGTPRASSFRNCRQGDVASATNADYKGSGYDKGHLCPAADMKHSREAMAATFQMWNMSPQEPSFNRGGWSRLEALVRSYIEAETDTLFVVTGPVFINNKGTIGAGNVTVPGFYYKALYCPRRGGIGFLMPNRKIDGQLQSWQVSIDLIEAFTGIDFFPQLPDERENEIESQTTWWGGR
jgi:endonuclease G